MMTMTTTTSGSMARGMTNGDEGRCGGVDDDCDYHDDDDGREEEDYPNDFAPILFVLQVGGQLCSGSRRGRYRSRGASEGRRRG